MANEHVEGWYGPPHATRFHYITSDARSLCGKWFVPAWSAELVDCAYGPAKGDCVDCKRKHEATEGVTNDGPPKGEK